MRHRRSAAGWQRACHGDAFPWKNQALATDARILKIPVSVAKVEDDAVFGEPVQYLRPPAP